jgi:putative Mg2+ transporter-C (MgtC) family protein
MSSMAWNFAYPILGAIGAGFAIGFEREWRGSAAGLRTHVLVSLASALLMLAAVRQIDWLVGTPLEVIRIDPVRMAHGILTGIGFLGAGVIFREGASIRGLTTAASLWITSVLGILFGVGLYALATIGSFAALAVLAAVTLTETLIPQRRYLDLEVCIRYPSPPLSSAFDLWLRSFAVTVAPLEQFKGPEGRLARFRLKCGRNSRIDDLVNGLEADAAVLSYKLVQAAV